MKYVLKQKLISFGDDFDVLDESGRKAFYFDSKIGGFSKKIVVEGPNKEQLAVIRKKHFTYRPTYTIKKNGEVIARIFKKAFSFRKQFIIDVPGPNDITIIGRFAEHSYRFLRNGAQIAEVSKKWFRSKDTYGVEIEDSNDTLLVLCGAVVVDLLCHPGRDSSFE